MALLAKHIQIKGPFTNEQNIVNEITKQYSNLQYIERLGIQSRPTHLVKIDDVTCEMGKTGLLEWDDIAINTISFLQDEPASTLVECMCILEK